MTIHQLIEQLDTFRNQYDTSMDPEVKKMCLFITSVIEKLNGYLAFFNHQKLRIEQSQVYYAEILETLNSLVGDINNDTTTPDDGILDLVGD